MIVDAHQHFLDPARADYPWLTDELAAIRRRFGPEELAPLLAECGVDGTVVVQARTDLAETRELLALAEAHDFVLGVVGWVDLEDPGLPELLAELGPKLVGVRHPVHDEPDPSWLLRDGVQRGLAAVRDAGLAYDLLVRTRELPAALETARRLPGLRLVVDHAAKPPFREGGLEAWAEALAPLAGLEHVSCKLSGLVTEADWAAWRPSELAPTIRRVLDRFGADRCLFGSDWPVCLLAATYRESLDLVRDVLAEDEREAVLGGTAVRVYGLA